MPRVRISYVILLMISFSFAYIQGGNLPYVIFYGICVSFLIALIYIVIKPKDIFIKVKYKKQIYYVGEKAEICVLIGNDGFMPIPNTVMKLEALSRVEEEYNGELVPLGIDESKNIISKVTFKSRGIYDFGKISLTVSDLFNIFKRKIVLNKDAFIKVYPKIYNLNKFVAQGNDIFRNSMSSKTNIEDIYTIRDVRKYNQGDSLKRIMWKVSAKYGELFVKDSDTVSGEECNIFLNMNKEDMLSRNSEEHEEEAVSLCISIANYLHLKGTKSNIFVNSLISRNFNIESREDINELMEFFLKQSSDSKNNFIKFINSNLSKIPKLSSIGIITKEVNEELKENLIFTKDKGYNIALFYCSNTIDRFNNIEFLKKSGIKCYEFSKIISNSGN